MVSDVVCHCKLVNFEAINENDLSNTNCRKINFEPLHSHEFILSLSKLRLELRLERKWQQVVFGFCCCYSYKTVAFKLLVIEASKTQMEFSVNPIHDLGGHQFSIMSKNSETKMDGFWTS